MVNELALYCLDVGQGDCTFVIPPQGGAILFDVRNAPVATHFVHDHDLELRAVVASHLDKDHVGGMLDFLEEHFRAGRSLDRLYIALDRTPNRAGDNALRALVERALQWDAEPPPSSLGFRIKSPVRDKDGPIVIAEGDDWVVELVLPFKRTVDDSLVHGRRESNRLSVALRVVRADTAILVGGDATLGSWENLEHHLVSARAIRVPHHGGDIVDATRDWQTADELYERVGAEVGVISVGTNNRKYPNRGRHPHPEHVAALRRRGNCRVICTQLTDRCHSSPAMLRGPALTLASSVVYPYRHRVNNSEVPCAGSIILSIDKGGELSVEPSPQAHAKLLDRFERPLCRAGPVAPATGSH